MRYKVRSGERILEFDGEKIATSSSFKPDSVRWVDFNLYVTVAGTYVLERIGQSDVFHTLACPTVKKNNLKFDPNDLLLQRHVECSTCLPDPDYDTIVIEKPRYYAVVTESPRAVIDALYKRDKANSTRYMTYVSQKLIEEAAKYDKRLEQEYRTEYIE